MRTDRGSLMRMMVVSMSVLLACACAGLAQEKKPDDPFVKGARPPAKAAEMPAPGMSANPKPPAPSAAVVTNTPPLLPPPVPPAVPVPPAAQVEPKAEPKAEQPPRAAAAKKGVGLTAAEQANIEAAINRLKQDLLAECLLTPKELKHFAKVPADTDLRRFGAKPVGKPDDAKLRAALDKTEKDAKLRAAMAETEKNGSVSGSLAQKFRFGLGEEILVGLALVKAGVSPQHPLIRQMWEDLRHDGRGDISVAGLPSCFTYRAGVGLMFVEAMMHSPSGEKWPQTKSEEARVRAWAQQVANDLVTAHMEGAWGYWRNRRNELRLDRRSELRLGGKHSEWWDNSNTQYAALGLKAARLCGWKPSDSVGSSVWRAMLDHFLNVQEENGPDVQLEVETEKPGRGGVDYSSSGWEKSAGDGYGYRATAQARGWSYGTIVSVTNATTSPSEMSSLNMTIAGLTAVILARSELRSLDRAKEEAANRAVRDGMAWVQRNWPGNGGGDGYGLYGIERLGVLGNLRTLGGHDWYRELAPGLAASVMAGGVPKGANSTEVADRAFFLLFLARGTSSAYASPVSDERP